VLAGLSWSSGSLTVGHGFVYSDIMTVKERVIQAVQDLPDDASIEDAMARLLLSAKVERGVKEADAGHLIDHREVKERMAKWLK
jgi:hypothetical protein